jgi:RHS repeat-associated protein
MTVNGKTEYWGNSYGYDPWGNLITKTPSKCSAENLNEAAWTNNQLHTISGSDNTYDAAGNMAHDATTGLNYTYDAENRITSAGGYAYTYDADGNRVEKSNGSTGTIYWYMSPGIVAESDLSGNAKSEYVFFDGERVARKDFPGNTISYYFSDQLKTASVITDSAGNIKEDEDYYPWGGELQLVNNDSNHYKFTGKERDAESGLDLMGVRYYGSAIGRFLRPDPNQTAGFEHMRDPQAWNGYSYARNNPLTYVDPDGLSYHVCVSGSDGKQQCSDVSDAEFDQAKQNPGAGISLKNGDIYSTVNGNQVKVGTYNQTDVDLNPFAQAVLTHPTLQTAAATMNDPRTYALWYGASALGGVGLYAGGVFEGGLTTLELSGGGEILSNQAAGAIIGWGTGQEGAAATEQLTSSLTRQGVQQMIDKGLTKATVQRLVFQYGRAIAEGGAKLANTQLMPRYQLMMKIIELWPK